MPRPTAASARVAAAALLLIALTALPTPGAEKVVFLGFDGADGNLTKTWMTEGHLPNLQALAESGSYALLEPSNPPQTPVSWSTFATGWNPGRTEIFDFLKRPPGSYLPTFGMNEPGREPALPAWVVKLGGKQTAFRVVALAAALVSLAVFLLVGGCLMARRAGRSLGGGALRALLVWVVAAVAAGLVGRFLAPADPASAGEYVRPFVLAALVFAVVAVAGSLVAARAPATGGGRTAGLVITALVAGLALGAGGAVGGGLADFLPDERPTVVNNRKGVPFWELAADAGLDVEIYRVANTFPARSMSRGRTLSGLGVPDLRGTVGTPTYYSSDPLFYPDKDEFSIDYIPLKARSGRLETRVNGPTNYPFYKYVVDRKVAQWREQGLGSDELARKRTELKAKLDEQGVREKLNVPLILEADPDAGTLRWEVSGQTGTLGEGEWSDWIRLEFPVNWLMDRLEPLTGIARLRLLTVRDEIRLYLTPVNFHPGCHPVPYAFPDDWSEELGESELYKTMGWAVDTWAISQGVGDEDMFLEDMYFTVDRFERFLDEFLEDPDADLYVQVFYFTDRLAHVFWRFLDPEHPGYDPAKAARYAPAVLEAYKRMDAIVGKTMERLGDQAVILVGSDHGFSSFRYQVNLNSWLVDNGFMTLQSGGGGGEVQSLEDLSSTRSFFDGVDWTRTQAYAIGLGNIYINVVGRESEGSVLPGEDYRDVVSRIRQGLLAFRDPKRGDAPVRQVYERFEDYGEDIDTALIPDLRAANNHNYRISWQCTLGAVEPEIVFDNERTWSGDHCSTDPSLVPGVFFANRPLTVSDPNIIDLAPTILTLLGVDVPGDMEGRDLLGATGGAGTP